MVYLNNFPSITYILVFLGVLALGNALQCYKCNVAINNNNEDPCLNAQEVQTCTDPAECLSVSYSFEGKGLKQFTTVKSCMMPNKNSCENFLNNVRATTTAPGKIEFSRPCYTCNKSGCNKDATKPPSPSKSSMTALPALLFVTFCCFLLKLI